MSAAAPFVYFPVAVYPTGQAWIRTDLVAAITPWEIVLATDPSISIKLADHVEPTDVLAALLAPGDLR